MNYLLGIIGLVIGLFLWSNVIGSLFASLPLQLKLKRVGVIPNVGWLRIVLPTVFACIIFILFFALSKPMFYGSLLASVLILFNLGNLKKEAYETFRKENPNAFENTDAREDHNTVIDSNIEKNILNIINGTAPTKLKRSVIHKLIDQSELSNDEKKLLSYKANRLLKMNDQRNNKLVELPDSDAQITFIWEYAKQFSSSKDGKDWNEWIGWGGEQYRIFKETGELPYSLDELQSCLYQCYERDQMSGDFHDGDVRQEFPRAIVKRLSELDGNQ